MIISKAADNSWYFKYLVTIYEAGGEKMADIINKEENSNDKDKIWTATAYMARQKQGCITTCDYGSTRQVCAAYLPMDRKRGV